MTSFAAAATAIDDDDDDDGVYSESSVRLRTDGCQGDGGVG